MPAVDVTTWDTAGTVTNTTANSFTNTATAAVSKDIGAVAGRMYAVTINTTRTGGTLRCYLTDATGTATNDHVQELSGGEESFVIQATGPRFTLRISIDPTTVVILGLSITEVSA